MQCPFHKFSDAQSCELSARVSGIAAAACKSADILSALQARHALRVTAGGADARWPQSGRLRLPRNHPLCRAVEDGTGEISTCHRLIDMSAWVSHYSTCDVCMLPSESGWLGCINTAPAGQVTAGDTVRFKQLTLPEAAALRVKVDAQVALLGKVATGNLSSKNAESQLQVGCLTIRHLSQVGTQPCAAAGSRSALNLRHS